LNPFAFITILNPGSAGPHVGEISTLGSANALDTNIPARLKKPKANPIVVNTSIFK